MKINMSPKDFVSEIKQELKMMLSCHEMQPTLAIINTYDTAANMSYIKGKLKDAEEIGIIADLIKIDPDTDVETFSRKIRELPHDGIILQLPLHPNFESFKEELLASIPPEKDVDGLGRGGLFTPCTPLGVKIFLDHNKIDLKGKNVVIVGRSELVGKPLAQLMTDADATVTLCHSHTRNLWYYTSMADIVVCAIGRPKFFGTDYFLDNKTKIVIDVGINRVDGKLVGDVDPAVADNVAYLTPVPGGVGLLTRMALMCNTCIAAMIRKE